MDVAEAIKARRSVRSYETNKKIEPEKLRLVLEAARLAPSAYNKQDCRYIVIDNKETLRELARACEDQNFIADAGAAICCCATNPQHWLSSGERTYPLDMAVAASFMMLQATELGLASCWIGAYSVSRVRRLLRIPEEVRVACIIVIGHPHYVPAPTTRKPMEEIFAAEHYDQPYAAD